MRIKCEKPGKRPTTETTKNTMHSSLTARIVFFSCFTHTGIFANTDANTTVNIPHTAMDRPLMAS